MAYVGPSVVITNRPCVGSSHQGSGSAHMRSSPTSLHRMPGVYDHAGCPSIVWTDELFEGQTQGGHRS